MKGGGEREKVRVRREEEGEKPCMFCTIHVHVHHTHIHVYSDTCSSSKCTMSCVSSVQVHVQVYTCKDFVAYIIYTVIVSVFAYSCLCTYSIFVNILLLNMCNYYADGAMT